MNITKEKIIEMKYTDFIAFIKETNRCPGGKGTVRKILNTLFHDKDTKILEIGSNTGFTSLEALHITRATIHGIDVSESCVHESNELRKIESKKDQDRLTFSVGSAYNIPYADEMFDILLTGGATIFMDNKDKAVTEYLRVMKNWGFVCITPLIYKIDPPSSVVANVEKAIGVSIKKFTTQDWIDLFQSKSENIEVYYKELNGIKHVDEVTLENYINYFIAKPHIVNMDNETKEVIAKKWKGYISVFNENHKYLDYAIIIFRKRMYPEEPELFLSTSNN